MMMMEMVEMTVITTAMRKRFLICGRLDCDGVSFLFDGVVGVTCRKTATGKCTFTVNRSEEKRSLRDADKSHLWPRRRQFSIERAVIYKRRTRPSFPSPQISKSPSVHSLCWIKASGLKSINILKGWQTHRLMGRLEKWFVGLLIPVWAIDRKLERSISANELRNWWIDKLTKQQSHSKSNGMV